MNLFIIYKNTLHVPIPDLFNEAYKIMWHCKTSAPATSEVVDSIPDQPFLVW
jgi:hypothetical protein